MLKLAAAFSKKKALPVTLVFIKVVLSDFFKIEDESIKNIMLVSFSNCVKKVSYADQRISVPVKLE